MTLRHLPSSAVLAWVCLSQAAPAVAGNYWGSPTGPTIASNPGGTGDPLDDRVAFTPFLTAPSPCIGVVTEIPAASTVGLAILSVLLGASALLRLRRSGQR
jgi:hypothetical protein